MCRVVLAAHIHASVAQLAEHGIRNAGVVGSIPTAGSFVTYWIITSYDFLANILMPFCSLCPRFFFRFGVK